MILTLLGRFFSAAALIFMVTKHADGAVEARQACALAGRGAGLGQNLPANLLNAIGQVESGRRDLLTGQIAAWPWTVNVDGAGRFFASSADAAAFIRLAMSSGARDVDVGCFQISLEQHPAAFASLDAALDPVSNAAAAAAFLQQLKQQDGSWDGAIAAYHSASPSLGLPYERRVLGAWAGLGSVPAGDLEAAIILATDPTVIEQSPAARLVRVIAMGSEAAGTAAGLPRVITP